MERRQRWQMASHLLQPRVARESKIPSMERRPPHTRLVADATIQLDSPYHVGDTVNQTLETVKSIGSVSYGTSHGPFAEAFPLSAAEVIKTTPSPAPQPPVSPFVTHQQYSNQALQQGRGIQPNPRTRSRPEIFETQTSVTAPMSKARLTGSTARKEMSATQTNSLERHTLHEPFESIERPSGMRRYPIASGPSVHIANKRRHGSVYKFSREQLKYTISEDHTMKASKRRKAKFIASKQPSTKVMSRFPVARSGDEGLVSGRDLAKHDIDVHTDEEDPVNHNIGVHNHEEYTREGLLIPKDEYENYTCVNCGRSYTRAEHLIRHQHYHMLSQDTTELPRDESIH